MRGMKCGTCYWARPMPADAPPEMAATQRICWGMPPTACLIPVQQLTEKKTLLSNPNAPPVQTQIVEQARRRFVGIHEDCCSIWEPQLEVKEAPRNKWRLTLPWLN